MQEGIYLRLLGLYKSMLRHNLHSLVPRQITNWILESRFRNKVYEVGGHSMYLNEGLFSLSLGKEFEPLETNIASVLVNEGDTVVDLGANIGYYTLMFAKIVGPSGRVVAFEPSPTNCELLEKNVQMNDYTSNVMIKQMAVSDRPGKTTLHLSVHPGDNRILSYDPKKGPILDNGDYLDIQTTTLDDYFGSNETVDFIKMDIQGAEYSAIMGMKSVINRNHSIKILTEFSPKLLKEFGSSSEDFLHVLQQYGFILYNINTERNILESSTVDDLLIAYSSEREDYTNLLLSREKLSDNLISNLQAN